MKVNPLLSAVVCSVLFSPLQVQAHSAHHEIMTPAQRQASLGIFDNKQVKPRPLSDWDGIWQSVNPYLQRGGLDPVLAFKASQQHKKMADLRAYYQQGYATDIDTIEIENNHIVFHHGKRETACHYQADGVKILTYTSGKKGVRYLFKCVDPTSKAPRYIQFSDHRIEPHHSEHFHLFSGNHSQQQLFNEMDNWPTFYPWSLSQQQIVDEMISHG